MAWRSSTPLASNGVADADMSHAITHHLYAGDIDDDEAPPRRVLYLGPDRTGNLLEVVVLERAGDPRDEDEEGVRAASSSSERCAE